MRVLHLAPPSTSLDGLTAHSFVDEEIVALHRAGATAFIVSDAIACPQVRDGIDLLAVRPGSEVTEVVATLRFAARRAHLWLPTAMLGARETFHILRIERAAARAIVDHGIDLVHSHFGWPGGFGGVLAAAHADVPLVASLRGMDLLVRSQIGYGLRIDPLFRAALHRLLPRAARTLYATEFMRREGIAAGAPRNRTVVIRKGVDVNRFRPAPDRAAARAELGILTPLILAVGTLSPRKSYHTLIDAAALLKDLPWTLMLCGDGPQREPLERLATTLGIGDRVTFAGAVSRDDIASFFAAADVFVHPAAIEAAGNVILESLASGCPVICTDSGGPSEYVSDGQTGYIVRVGATHPLASRLRLLLQDTAHRACMSAAARTVAEERYSYTRMTSGYLRAYGAVLRERRKGCATSARSLART
jgi:teichuronic acid biosynthesis glycosyltransferase TuaC